MLDRLITRNIRGPSPGRDPFGQPLPGEITTVKLWAARRDFPARDFLDSTTAGLVTIMDSRFIVRDTGAAWATGDTFTDDEGKQRTVQGVSDSLRAGGVFWNCWRVELVNLPDGNHSDNCRRCQRPSIAKQRRWWLHQYTPLSCTELGLALSAACAPSCPSDSVLLVYALGDTPSPVASSPVSNPWWWQ